MPNNETAECFNTHNAPRLDEAHTDRQHTRQDNLYIPEPFDMYTSVL